MGALRPAFFTKGNLFENRSSTEDVWADSLQVWDIVLYQTFCSSKNGCSMELQDLYTKAHVSALEIAHHGACVIGTTALHLSITTALPSNQDLLQKQEKANKTQIPA